MITSVRSESFPFHRLALTLAALFMASGSALASEANGLYWLFQRTGYSSGYTPFGQTAVAMGDSKSWPVVFSLSSSSTVQASTVQAYTLSPVNNPVTKTFWKQIGTNVITGTGFSILTAKSSSDGRVGAVLRNSLDTSLYPNPNSYVAAVGRRSTGFTAPLANVAGIAFDAAGNLVTASASTLAGSGTYSLSAVRSIAVTPWGDIGVLNSNYPSYQVSMPVYYEKSQLTGWQSSALYGLAMSEMSGDLAIDTAGRPIFAYGTYNSSTWGVAAAYFDIMSGDWKQQTLAIGLAGSVLPTIASDGIGGIGVSWMSTTASGSSNSLMYAYKNGSSDWAIHNVTSNLVSSGTSTGVLSPQLRVGLDYDAENYPVISFLANNGDIWLAYDPIVPVPEPSTYCMALVGLAYGGYTIFRRRKRA